MSGEHSRVRFSVGGGGAYLNHAIGNEFLAGGLASYSGFGAQFVVGGDVALTHSGRLRAGFTARYFYLKHDVNTTTRILAAGPEFAYSF